MENLRLPFIVSIYGKLASGKSYLMKYILCLMRAEGRIDVIFVFTSTKKNEFFDNMVDTKFVMHYDEKLLVQFLEEGQGHIIGKKNILLVFDDCIGLVNWKAPIVEEVFSTHRHNHVSTLVSTHYPSKLPTLIQEVSLVACIFKQVTRWS
jgi:tRNA A37 threonylcarbamoyladenosine biosynthesis protein TsaE